MKRIGIQYSSEFEKDMGTVQWSSEYEKRDIGGVPMVG